MKVLPCGINNFSWNVEYVIWLILPSFLNWIRTEKVNSYTRELKEYFRA